MTGFITVDKNLCKAPEIEPYCLFSSVSDLLFYYRCENLRRNKCITSEAIIILSAIHLILLLVLL